MKPIAKPKKAPNRKIRNRHLARAQSVLLDAASCISALNLALGTLARTTATLLLIVVLVGGIIAGGVPSGVIPFLVKLKGWL